MSASHRVLFSSAMRSYNAMETTKRRHFDYLTMLESKKKKYNIEATVEERELLESLLLDHHEEVQAFKKRCDQLKVENEDAHQALFEYITRLNGVFSSSADVTH